MIDDKIQLKNLTKCKQERIRIIGVHIKLIFRAEEWVEASKKLAQASIF